ncbi:hypothetical protein [Deinococcus cellulosilyticus]|uniref:Uncharacterized protein n=1 Tax=Deinococcus cellulosilyticus (strain DSM 18568 / NBRC 106333 / KACC 11606 / 5516J-15) TaxID=1223518 RepID=A0A511MVH8_DEIC1|nr:hypothetical protein [Deinococcus cellulosilyticus]GEM44589.1 hypothetical protein DC3_02240 [Deinococcus cellulosilyticus NBRC 106333 = KACC 11606]
MDRENNIDWDDYTPPDDIVAISLAEIAHYLSIGLNISFGAAVDLMNSTNIVPFTLKLDSDTRKWIDQDAEGAAIRIAEKAGFKIEIEESMQHLVSLF